MAVDTVTADQVDPEIAPLLDAMVGFRVSADTLPTFRESTPVGDTVSTDDVERAEHVVDEARGIVVRVHRPRGAAGPHPCAYSIHGGGYVLGNRDMDDAKLARWARRLGCVGVSVEHRLAPEAPYPEPLEDCYAGLRWVDEHADELGVDRSRIGVAGTSAGAGLAAALALVTRERAEMPLRFQLLECPMIDDRQQTASSRLDGLPIWDRHSNEFGWRSYLGDLYGTDAVPALAAPARASDLSGLPPAFVAVGTIDGFRDEDVDYAMRLNRAGVPTELHVYPGAPHGFQIFEQLAVTKRAARDADEWLERQLAPSSRERVGR